LSIFAAAPFMVMTGLLLLNNIRCFLVLLS
jgi:hypothetical protein